MPVKMLYIPVNFFQKYDSISTDRSSTTGVTLITMTNENEND